MSSRPQSLLHLKVLLLGDGYVGKTSLRKRFMGQNYDAEYLETLGADFAIKSFTYKNKITFRYQIWDIAGQPRFNQIRKSFYLGGQAAMAVFDVTNPNSAENLNQWTDEFWKNNGKGILPIILIANKIDLRDQADVCLSKDDGENIADQMSHKTPFTVPYIETSAKTGKNVDLAFDRLAELYVAYYNIMF